MEDLKDLTNQNCKEKKTTKTTTKKKDILLLRIALINKHCKHAINCNEAVTEHF